MENEFNKYLSNLGISPKSHKNYRSDISHFTSWLILKVRSFGSYIETLAEGVPFLNNNLAHEYKNYMLENKVSLKTVNRRLSTLRHLSRFLVAGQIIDTDFVSGIENATEFKKVDMVDEFKSYLESEKISKNTVKNYISDVKQFLSWLESKNYAQ
jgi:site-specific recombinase XerD